MIDHDICQDDVLRCVGHPWLPSGVAVVQDDVPRAITDTSEIPEEFAFAPKEFHIRIKTLEKYGFSDGCPKCRVIMSGRPSLGNSHSSACRSRIAEKMKEDPKESKQVAAAEARRNRFLDSEIDKVIEFQKKGGNVVRTEEKKETIPGDVMERSGGSADPIIYEEAPMTEDPEDGIEDPAQEEVFMKPRLSGMDGAKISLFGFIGLQI